MKNNLIALLFISLLCSCDKELDVKPDSQITATSFWTTQEDVTGARSGMYARFRSFTDFNLYYLGEARSEIMGTGILNADFRIPYFQNRLNKITAPGPDWGSIYTVIHDINLILKYTPGIAFTSESNKNTILAEAYTMRRVPVLRAGADLGRNSAAARPDGVVRPRYDLQTTGQRRRHV